MESAQASVPFGPVRAEAPPSQAGLVRRLDASGVPVLLVRLAVGGFFAYAALGKMADPVGFIKSIANYEFWPYDPPYYLNATAIVIPALELVCAGALVLGLFRRAAALIVAGLLLVFTWLIIGLALNEYAQPASGVAYASFCKVLIGCGCSGNEKVNACWKIVENVALFGGALLALCSSSHRFGLDRLIYGHRPGDRARISAE